MKNRKLFLWITSLIILIIILAVINLNTGEMRVSPSEILQLVIGKGTYENSIVIFNFRLPRIIVAILVGFALAIAGNVLQITTQNPMADTSFLGINAGSGLAVMLFIAFVKDQDANLFLLPCLALLGAIFSTALVFICAYKKDTGITANRLLLTGVALSGCFSSVMVLFTLKLSPENYQFVMNWLTGSIWGTSWSFILIFIPWFVIFTALIFSKSKILDTFNLGDDSAKSLGISLKKERIILIGSAAILAGVSVSISGSIGFIGLITPNLARRVIGFRSSKQLILSGFLGSCLLIASDTLGKIISTTTELPVGIIVAVIGAPYFVYILIKSNV
ncbi:iron ABC transporter permease [Companilactobacillus allii]|uniref:Iron ABC transporter permease n=1 Tax=Companilactobacillus allii TaxID=1847728 RepID=A0A1P8Q0S7_9LACO|nr:iron ABC transporter permease [Companilactobacillus allii]APX71427.1 iron ABC transporter permease [Companilactobacillus allii]USQ68508.1 iron ABC transporter permease [Companilactobacillus allii]